MGARETALTVLIACRKHGAWSNSVLKEYLLRDNLDRREAGLATRLCYGVLQNRALLDFYLKQLLTGKSNKLHPLLRDILHLGLYQLYCMDRIPQSAAVNESVALAKKYCNKQPHAPGLVNAVLRAAVRTMGSLQQPVALADRYSHPQKLVDLLHNYVGDAALESMLSANNAAPETVVQVNTLCASAEEVLRSLEEQGVSAQPHRWLPDCFVLSAMGNIEQLNAFCNGWIYAQDAAAKLSVLCAQLPKEDLQVLDCCAAPGGKTFAAAIAMGGNGQIYSCDIHSHKIALIQKGAQRLGFDNITVYQQDAAQYNPQWEASMDAVIADVPCSGYGIIRKKPDIRYKDPDTMNDLPQLQLQILNNQCRYVKPGGILLYSTCTLVRKENEGVVKRFLQFHPEFETEALPLPDIFPENTSGMLVLVPGQYETDGFFICRMRRKS